MNHERQVLNFLSEFKRLLCENKAIICGDRLKNRETLIMLGITEEQRKDCLVNLTKSDYSEGPKPNDNGEGEVWIFGLRINSEEIYIKLTINNYNGKTAICISFHIAEFPMNYPFK